MPPFVARINDALLYKGPDGREAFVFPRPGEVIIVTDIHQQGAPHNAVPFSTAALRTLVEMSENLQQPGAHPDDPATTPA